MLNSNSALESQNEPGERSIHLQPEHIAMINEALAHIGEFGEDRLIVEKGQIRFVKITRSFDALKWRAGRTRAAKE